MFGFGYGNILFSAKSTELCQHTWVKLLKSKNRYFCPPLREFPCQLFNYYVLLKTHSRNRTCIGPISVRIEWQNLGSGHRTPLKFYWIFLPLIKRKFTHVCWNRWQRTPVKRIGYSNRAFFSLFEFSTLFLLGPILTKCRIRLLTSCSFF